MKKKKIYELNIERNGFEFQLRKVQEEAAELIAAINHYIDKRHNGEEHLLMEFIDTEITMEQIRPLLNQEKLSKNKNRKLKRLERRLKK